MNLLADAGHGLCADESSTRRERQFVHLRERARRENKKWHCQKCETFSRHLSSGVLRDVVFVSIRLARVTRIGGKHKVSALMRGFASLNSWIARPPAAIGLVNMNVRMKEAGSHVSLIHDHRPSTWKQRP